MATQDEAMVELSPEQQRTIGLIYEVFKGQATWPTFQYADKVLAHEDIDLQEVLRSMPQGLVFPDVRWGGWFYRAEDELKLTVAGLNECPSAGREIRYFIDALRYIARREWEDVPQSPNEVSNLQVTSDEIKQELGGDDADLARTHLLFSIEPSIYSVLSGKGSEWSLQPSIEVRRFRGVRDVEEYLRTKAAFMPARTPQIHSSGEEEESSGRRIRGVRETGARLLGPVLRHPIVSSVIAGLILALLKLR